MGGGEDGRMGCESWRRWEDGKEHVPFGDEDEGVCRHYC